MKKIIFASISAILSILLYTGCSKEQMAAFQANDQEPPYNLMHLFDNFPSLHAAVDSLDTMRLNNGLSDMIINGYDTPQFLRNASDLVKAPFLVPMLHELNSLLVIVMDQHPYHYVDTGSSKDGGFYDDTDGTLNRPACFYSAIDQVTSSTELSGDILDIATQIVDYLVKEKTPVEIEEDMSTLGKVTFYTGTMYTGSKVSLGVGTYNFTDASINMNDMVQSIEVPLGMKVTCYQDINKAGTSWTFTGNNRALADDGCNLAISSVVIENDISKMAKLLGNLLMACDYPMWLDSSGNLRTDRDNVQTGPDTNTDLGNASKGIIKLVSALNSLASTDPAVRNTIDNILLQDLPALISDPDSKAKMKTLIQNLAYYFAADEITSNAYATSDYHNTNPYVNASLKESVRDLLPNLQKLFIRDDATGTIKDFSIFNSNGTKMSPVEALTVTLNKMKKADPVNFDYSLAANRIEPSLLKMMQLDGTGRTRGTFSNLSMFDHLVYTIAGSYYFGYKVHDTGVRNNNPTNGEPYGNWGYIHGESTKGVLTLNDCLYSQTSKDVTGVLLGCPTGLITAYNLALGDRVGQADKISRSSEPFTKGNRGNYKFYLGYNFPPMLLLPSNCAGDAGLPNGGHTISPEPNAQTGDDGTRNDYRTYWPKVADGKGILNTAHFLMSWMARACWDGQGPYYATTGSTTTSFNMPVSGTQTVNVYYKPNGEIYAYVYKQDPGNSGTWEYYYPVSGDDIDDNGRKVGDPSVGQRANRYKDIVKSDYYLIEYYQLLQDGTVYGAPPMNPDGIDKVEAGYTGWYHDAGAAFGGHDSDHIWCLHGTPNTSASYFQLYEKIDEHDAVRECASQDEAMYRNFQWLMYEKKFLFIIPMYANSGLQTGSYILIEANGVVGQTNAKKGSENGYWNIASGTGNISQAHVKHRCDTATGPAAGYISNNPNYGDSTYPGDSRIIVFSDPDQAHAILNNDLMVNILGSGSVLPDAVGRNIEPFVRLGFPQYDCNISSNDTTATWSSAYANRNKMLPIFVALAGTLRDGTYYDRSGEAGYNYNFAGKHKYPIQDLMEGVLMQLSKPHFRYFSAANHSETVNGRWVPRVKAGEDYEYRFFNPNTGGANINYYLPNDSLRSLTSVLSGNGVTESNGILPLMAEKTGTVSSLLALLQDLGSDTYATQRGNVALGLEQLLTAMKVNRSESIANNRYTTLDFSKYNWMFYNVAHRDEDINVEDFLSYEGASHASDDWSDFDDFYDMVSSLMGGSRDVSQNLVNIVDAVLAQPLTENEVHGLIYTAGKLFAKHPTVPGTWQYQGYDHGTTDRYDQLVDILSYLPQVHNLMADNGTGRKYDLMLKNVDILLKDQGSLLHYMIEGMREPFGAGYVISDLHRFLSWEIVSSPDSPLWDDLAYMLEAIADMNDPRVDINTIISNLGFQSN